jgi:deazaflavin-dependent oxidoreductase (nitroreductase family)
VAHRHCQPQHHASASAIAIAPARRRAHDRGAGLIGVRRSRFVRSSPGYPERVTESDDDALFGAEHVRVYRDTAGERGYRWRGTTILLLTTTGRTSGEPRTTPLIHRTDGDRWVVVASKGGAPDHPDWYKNLQADPEATIEVGAEKIPVVATTATGDERARLWAAMNEDWPDYDDYQRQTEREIPVVVLTRR